MTIIDEAPPASSLQALRSAASAKLDAQAMRARRYQLYYDGESEIIALLDTADRQTFAKFLHEAGADWCELIVNAVAERLQIVGFRFADAAASELAWQVWQASGMDADGELVQTDALVTGQSFALVQPDEDGDNPTGVEITAESPFEACVLYEPGNRRHRIAGYKRFAGIDPQDYPWPWGLVAEPAEGVTDVLFTDSTIAIWQPGSGTPLVQPNPAGVVGLVEIVPQPRTWGPPRSELTPALPIQDRIHTTLFNRQVAVDYGANRQVWATGVKMQRQTGTVTGADGVTQEVVSYLPPYNVGANRLLVSENPAARFGAIPESALGGYLAAVDQDVLTMAAITQTPAWYFQPIANLSADAIKASEAGLVAKISRRALHIGEGWEEVMRTALAVIGHPAARDRSAEVLWKDFQTRSVAQLVDALVKMRTLGVPIEELWRQYGATPGQVDEWRRMRVAEESGPQLAPQPVPAPASGKSKAQAPPEPLTP